MPVTPTITREVGEFDMQMLKATWNLLQADPIGVGIQLPEHADKTWHFRADTGGAATCEVQGSHTDVEADYATLSNAAGGAAISVAAGSLPACITQIENPLFSRPKLTVPGTGSDWTVTLVARWPTRLRA